MTDARASRPSWATNDRYRTAAEERIRDFLVLSGWSFEFQAGEAGLEERAAAALDRLVALGLPYRTTPSGRHFDPVETLNFIKTAGLTGEDSFWIDRFVSTGRRLVESLPAGEQRFEATFRRTFNLGLLDRQVRLRLPVPLVCQSLRDLEVRPAVSDSLATRVYADRIEARGEHVGPEASLEARFAFRVSPDARDSDLRDRERYLAASEGFVRISKPVADLAAALASDATSPGEAARRVWDFLLDELCLGAVHYDAIAAASSAPEWVLDAGWFDCQVGSALFVSLCRALGIPARMLSGYVLYPAAPFFHYWAEAWVDPEGWIPFDLMSWDLSAGGRDLLWRDRFAGRIDARMITTCLPLRFTGAPGVPIPPVWRVLSRPIAGGAETRIESVETGALIFRDEVRTAPVPEEVEAGRAS